MVDKISTEHSQNYVGFPDLVQKLIASSSLSSVQSGVLHEIKSNMNDM